MIGIVTDQNAQRQAFNREDRRFHASPIDGPTNCWVLLTVHADDGAFVKHRGRVEELVDAATFRESDDDRDGVARVVAELP